MQSQQRMAELAHVNRFSTAGEMAASIAHEINQPLGAILNNIKAASCFSLDRPDLKEIRNILGDIRRNNASHRGDPASAQLREEGALGAKALRSQR